VGAARERAGGEEQQALEQGMVERVEEGGGERQRGPSGLVARREQERRPEAEQDDTDVLDGVEGEQPLELVLEDRVGHAAER